MKGGFFISQIEGFLKAISDSLTKNSSPQVDQLLSNIGVTKGEFLKKVNELNARKITDKDINNMMNNLSPAEIENINQKKAEIEKLYQSFKQNEGK